MNLTVADGFKLGCGLLLAGAFGGAALLLMAAFINFLARVLNVPLPLPGA